MTNSQPVAATVFILSLSSDIGQDLAYRFLAAGHTVVGTYRHTLPEKLKTAGDGLTALPCDINNPESVAALVDYWQSTGAQWDIFISCVGQLAPIGLFFETDYAAWEASVVTNSLAQLRVLHALHSFRDRGNLCHVVFFAGGGTNSPFRNYSAYCLGKISLIKMCELLDDENPDLNAFIVGTGWVRTKIHEQTLEAGAQAGENLGKTRTFYEQHQQGTALEDIYEMIRWGIARGKTVASGRNFSVVHDSWRDGGHSLAAALSGDTAKFKLRRYGNEDKSTNKPID